MQLVGECWKKIGALRDNFDGIADKFAICRACFGPWINQTSGSSFTERIAMHLEKASFTKSGRM